jgi:ubiquinone biosynthesis protein COQ9
MDMTLGFIADTQNLELALRVADEIEYTWQQDKHHDSFYKD